MPYIPNKADEQGRSNWKPGDMLQPGHLNHIEDGLVYATEEAEKKELPSSGNIGDVLTKTADGVKWWDGASRINIIKVDGEQLPIEEDKSVNIELADRFDKKVDKVAGKGLSEEDFTTEEKAKLASVEAGAEVNVQSDWNQQNIESDAFIKNKPTKLSQFENNGDGNSKFATEQYVQREGGKIDKIKVNGSEQTIVEKVVDLFVPTRTSDIINDSNFAVDANYVHTDNNLTNTLKEQISTNKADIAQEIVNRTNADNELNDRINNLEALGRYLSTWDCTTGLPATQPTVSPYNYKTGDYFIVSKVGEVNYKPVGKQYIKDTPSREVETGSIKANDFYIFDSTEWKVMPNAQREVAFSQIAGIPEDNTELNRALLDKQDRFNTGEGIKLVDSILSVDTDTIATVAQVNAKQDTLISGTNIKTINNQSILGSGNLEIESGGGYWVIDPLVPGVPAWNSKLAPIAAKWNIPETSILGWENN